jgi:hypothetical protein
MNIFWDLIPNWLKYAIAALMAASSLLACGFLAGKHQGRQEAITDILRQDIKAERERGKDDEKLRGLPDYDLCVVALRRRGLPVDQCDELRGVQAE